MKDLLIEFSDNTLVATDQGVQRLATLLDRHVFPCLWAVRWKFGALPNGISFHASHKAAKDFVNMQIDSEPDGPARLVDVSDHIMQCVNKNGYCWTNLTEFSEAKTYEGETWKH
ncbi:MAG: hypothetical protein EOO61_04480 [Hymenobacter sp.]|nr:MAG: hypothetical protein EOO61_04480 [Hymenobacter sp.]